jgi:hypothetical protein
MTSPLIPLKKKSQFAPDILAKSQGWMNMVSSLRVSNLRVGQHLTNILGEKDYNDTSEIFYPLFSKVFELRDGYVVVLGGVVGFRVWKLGTSGNSDRTPTLLLETSDLRCIDAAHFSSLFFLLLRREDRSPHHTIRSVPFCSTSRKEEREFESDAIKISCVNKFLIVALSSGSFNILTVDDLRHISTIPSYVDGPLVFTTSPRWIAIQSKS